MNVIVSFCAICLLLALGKFLRVKVRLFQMLYLPSSVIGGLLGLVILQCGGDYIPAAWTAGWSRLPGILITIVFAALFLGVNIPPLRSIWKQAGPQLAYGQIVAWGQYVVGLGMVVLLLGPLMKVPSLFGVIVPVGFEGGHGTAGGLAPAFRDELGWAEGVDFMMASATAGIVAAIIVGMALVNWAVRRGHVAHARPLADMAADELAGLYPADNRPAAGRMTVNANSVDALALHLAIIGVAITLGVIIKHLLVSLEGLTPGLREAGIMKAFPLFPLCMVGGLLVQLAMQRYGRTQVVDHGLMQRLAGTALDFLVVAAISMIRLEVIAGGMLPFLLIIFAGIGWNVFCVMWLARRLLPDAWFERAMAEMGQSMGVTATGLLLLRVVDPENKTPALSAFGYKQLLHEPFMGGGLWTSAAVLLVWRLGAWPVLGISVAAVIAWLIAWKLLFAGKASPGA